VVAGGIGHAKAARATLWTNQGLQAFVNSGAFSVHGLSHPRAAGAPACEWRRALGGRPKWRVNPRGERLIKRTEQHETTDRSSAGPSRALRRASVSGLPIVHEEHVGENV